MLGEYLYSDFVLLSVIVDEHIPKQVAFQHAPLLVVISDGGESEKRLKVVR
jgi:hypothetical protein